MHFLITAGGTREAIDPVRFISNASSGKMGHALARAALAAGHRVTLITAPTHLKPPAGAETIDVVSAADLFEAVKARLDRCDCLIMAAAVSDYTPARPSRTKLKKTGSRLTLDLKPTRDILKWAGRRARDGRPILVGFALEDRDVRANALKKLRGKRLDLIVANGPQAIGADRSGLLIKDRTGPWIERPAGTKTSHARFLVRLIESIETHP